MLGAVFQEFLARKEDYLKALRGFLRELVRQVRSEFGFTIFARSLMQERTEPLFVQLDQVHKVCLVSVSFPFSLLSVSFQASGYL